MVRLATPDLPGLSVRLGRRERSVRRESRVSKEMLGTPVPEDSWVRRETPARPERLGRPEIPGRRDRLVLRALPCVSAIPLPTIPLERQTR